jgi:very-short-patch-repair endonuclease
MKWPEIKEIATKLRNNPTSSESKLWKVIRNKQLMGRKFLRQHPIIYDINRNNNEFFFFIPDFYCSHEKLIIELDGQIHDYQKDKDYQRDIILAANNLRVLRIENDDLCEMENIKMKIIKMFDHKGNHTNPA